MLIQSRLLKTLGILGLIGTIAAGCKAPRSLLFRSQVVTDTANFTIQVDTTTQPGQYEVSGTADLPAGTELTVMAVRYLYLRQPPTKSTNLEPTYSILAYNTVDIENNRWETQLSLWQIANNGSYKEAWQLHEPDLTLAVEPEDTVLFLATLAPVDDLEDIERQLAGDNQQFASRFIQTTLEGSCYLKTGQIVDIDLPTGRTTAVAIQPEDINGGWGNRFLQLPDPPNPLKFEFPEHRQTNAPLTQEEILY